MLLRMTQPTMCQNWPMTNSFWQLMKPTLSLLQTTRVHPLLWSQVGIVITECLYLQINNFIMKRNDSALKGWLGYNKASMTTCLYNYCKAYVIKECLCSFQKLLWLHVGSIKIRLLWWQVGTFYMKLMWLHVDSVIKMLHFVITGLKCNKANVIACTWCYYNASLIIGWWLYNKA